MRNGALTAAKSNGMVAIMAWKEERAPLAPLNRDTQQRRA
jgi:hypothetical protein